jgi:hypothetical protein
MINQAEEQVSIIRERLKTAQSHQKSYYDRHHQEVQYQTGEKAYLRVTPLKGVHRFGIKGKLAPRYVGPFPILAKRGELAYQLELPSTFPKSMISSMCPNSSIASNIPSMVLTTRHLIFKRI